ncbi:V-type ATP synthase subunit I [Bauldia sp.]|uniref:V-type ATP synthase subunit I n=1 Tax=Bauldia sp. TaxID=2575872 RepID=UPI003BAC2825
MSIAPLKRVTLCGLVGQKHDVLEGLQRLGCMHLVPLRPPPAEIEDVALPYAASAYRALRFLTDVKDKRRQVRHDTGFDVEAFVQEVTDLRRRLRDVTDRRDFLAYRIREVEPWGDIVFPPRSTLAGYRIWFYVLPLRDIKALNAVALPWQIIRKDNRFAHLVVIADEEPPSDLLPVPRVHMGALSLSDLKAQLEAVEVELEDLTATRQALTRYIYMLSRHLAEAENVAQLSYAEQQTRDDDQIVAVQGWAPESAIPDIEVFADDAELACLVEDPAPEDEPPTLIDQPDNMEAGVDLTLFYQVPSYRSWDPTVVLVLSFSLFFAMILADAGYGLVLFVGLLVFWRRLGRSEKSISYRRFALLLTTCTIVYGVLVGSYFGMNPREGSLLGDLQILDVRNFDAMMQLSIVVGVIHIGFANAMVAYVNRTRLVALSSLGWIAAIVGGLLIWLGAGSDWQTVGFVLLTIGAAMILLFTSDRPIRKATDYLWRLADGVRRLFSAMSAFGDVLSYMRLFALGLASASLATTFNDLAREAHASIPGLGLLAAVLIIVVGHGLNLGLALMSGVVHGLRLNFIEFYNWGLPEEGKPFRKFARKEVQP